MVGSSCLTYSLVSKELDVHMVGSSCLTYSLVSKELDVHKVGSSCLTCPGSNAFHSREETNRLSFTAWFDQCISR
jgi:hypothetical protein